MDSLMSKVTTLDEAKRAIQFRLMRPVADVLLGRGKNIRKVKDPVSGLPIMVVATPEIRVAVGVRKDRSTDNLILEIKVKTQGGNTEVVESALNKLRVTLNRIGFRAKPLINQASATVAHFLVDPEDMIDAVVKNRQRIHQAALDLGKELESAKAPAQKAASTKRTASNVTAQEYYKEIKRLAQEVRENEAEYEDESDALHGLIGDHQYVIYPGQSLHVLMYTRNDDAIFEEGVGLEGANSMMDVYSQAAYFAMMADVREELARSGT